MLQWLMTQCQFHISLETILAHAGYDDVPASIAKQLINSYITSLTYLFNKSIVKGIFPSELKVLLFLSRDILLKYQIIVQYQFFLTFLQILKKYTITLLTLLTNFIFYISFNLDFAKDIRYSKH